MTMFMYPFAVTKTDYLFIQHVVEMHQKPQIWCDGIPQMFGQISTGFITSLALYLMTLTAPLLLWYVFPVTISKSSNKIDPSVRRLIIVVQICKKLP